MKLTEDQKQEFLTKCTQVLFFAHNERESYYNTGVKEKILHYLSKDVEVLIPLIEDLVNELK